MDRKIAAYLASLDTSSAKSSKYNEHAENYGQSRSTRYSSFTKPTASSAVSTRVAATSAAGLSMSISIDDLAWSASLARVPVSRRTTSTRA